MAEYVHTAEVMILLHVRDDEHDNDEKPVCKHIPLRAAFSTPEEMYEALQAIMQEMDPVLGEHSDGT